MVSVVIDVKQFEEILKKYPAVSREYLEEWVINKCKFYNRLSQEELEKYGFEEGKKFEFNDKIKDSILFVDLDYEPTPTQEEIDKAREEKKALEFYDDEELIDKEFPEPEWIIQNQIPSNEIGIMAGKRGERKTFMALYQAICVASGKSCAGDEVPKPRNVFFISEEDDIIQLSIRIKQIKKGLGIEKKKLPIKYFTLNNLKFDLKNGKIEKFMKMLDEFKPALIIVDTFQRCVSFDADKDNREISEFFINFASPLSKKYNCSWLFIHHLRKGISGSKPPEDLLDEIRGGSEIVNFPRFILFCQIPPNSKELIVFKILKMSYSEIPEAKVISFTNTEEDGLKIEYIGKPEDVISSASNCARAIKKWLFEKNITEFRTKDIHNAANEIGFKKSMISEGLRLLRDSQFLISPKRGYYQVNKGEIE